MTMYNPLYSGEFIRDVYLEPERHLEVLFLHSMADKAGLFCSGLCLGLFG